jgi:hypothetical protein
VAALAPGVGGVADEPVAGDARGGAGADADGDVGGAEDGEDRGGEREDVQRPGALEEAEPGIAQQIGREPGVGAIDARQRIAGWGPRGLCPWGGA